MPEYILSVVLIAALAAFAELVSYSSGKDAGHKLAVSVIILYCIISPIVPLVKSIADFDVFDFTVNEDDLVGGAYLEVSEDAFREGILKSITEKWNLREDMTVVSVIGFDFQKMRAEKIIITLLSGGIAVDFREIEKYIEEAGLGVCEVKYAVS